jgi:cobalt-zinc-cadmium efflux system membrane fusion protein
VSKHVFARAAFAASACTTLATLATLATFVAGCGGKQDAAIAAAAQKPSAFRVTDEQRAKLKIVTLSSENFRPTLEVTGTVSFNGDKSTQVLSPVSGPVSKIVTTLGANVTAGEALALVASPDFAADVATYRKSETALRNTARILKLDEQLFANDALARSELDQARSDNAGAEADRDAAMLALRSLGLDDATINAIRDGQRTAPVQGTIVAPIPGTVVEKLINPGQLLAAGTTPAFTVADLSSMWVIASVYASDIPLVTKGVDVDILMDASPRPVHGVVDYVAPIVDPGTKATTVRIVAENAGQLLKRDMFVRMVVHSRQERSGLLVPVAAVLRDDDNLPFVFVANAEGAFMRRRVTLGYRVADRYEIVTGLAAGEKIVADGALFVQFAENQ